MIYFIGLVYYKTIHKKFVYIFLSFTGNIEVLAGIGEWNKIVKVRKLFNHIEYIVKI